MKKSPDFLIASMFLVLPWACLETTFGQETGKLYVVGMGPAGPDLTAPRALDIVEQADVLLCSPRLPERFARFGVYIDPSKVAFNPWEGILGRHAGTKDPDSQDSARAKQREKVQNFVREQIQAGKTVVMMDGGDPCVYGPTLNHLLLGMTTGVTRSFPAWGPSMRRPPP